ncbi:isocitrate lyase 1 [Sugiyamaella lignohabitans]|uniref:Isocitrate lyase 1 n=1 Tax=Sugiyamaella lignohabitans TaxID=796027 RepID=A0A167EZD2_9ASCO|nr:isocitrate lyase 1 [Sugiyamaella lignohabitans]ANB14635.1 isocitrate lyase 1 [Sugiyamaella lignohabitans]
MSSPAAKFRQLLSEPGVIIAPGVYDGLSARAATSSKAFKALYMTGAGTVASRLGAPDVGLASLPDMAANASLIANIDRSVPLIADADTGYGNSAMCARTLSLYSQAGVAALHVEDQVHSKRCGHLLGKQLVSAEEFVSRIKAMAIERKRIQSDIVIIARTDSLQSLGVDEAIERSKQAVAVGADVIFVEGVENSEQAKKIVSALNPTPVLVNIVPNGVTPNWSEEEIQELGFKIAIFPGVTLGPAFAAMSASLEALAKTRKDPTGAAAVAQKSSPKEFFLRLGLGEIIALDKAVGGTAFEGSNI